MKLINGDCFKEIKNIPDNSIDLVIIDPPYEKKGNGYYCGGGSFGSKNRDYHNQLDNNNLLNGINNKILDELLRVMKKCNIYIWCNKQQLRQYINYFENKGFNTDLLTWHKTNPVPTCNNKYLSDTEYLLFFREKSVKIYGNYKTKKKYYVTPTNKEDKKLYNHPTVKPLNIIENLIVNSSKENDIVLDCYMGSGTTGVACKILNRNFIGIEIDTNYFNIAKQRIESLNNQLTFDIIGNIRFDEKVQVGEDLKGQENLTISYCKSLEDYKSRCEKAIEYLQYAVPFRYQDLLNILQNGSDE